MGCECHTDPQFTAGRFVYSVNVLGGGCLGSGTIYRVRDSRLGGPPQQLFYSGDNEWESESHLAAWFARQLSTHHQISADAYSEIAEEYDGDHG